MTDATKALIDKAIADKTVADSARGDVATQQASVKDADDKLAAVQAEALADHNAALESAHAAIAALMGEVES